MNDRIARVGWNLDRFGLSPRKLRSRLTNRDGYAIVSNSLPKAGTHLLERALCLTTPIYRAPVRTLHRRTLRNDLDTILARLKPNQLLVTHLEFTSERASLLSRPGLRTILLVRDPRDIVVSQSHFIPQKSTHAHHATFAGLSDPNERMRLVIRGSAEADYPSLRERLDEYAGWLSAPVLLIRYEDIVGPAGGGDSIRQIKALDRVFRHVGLELTESQVAGLAAKMFSHASPTFRRGTTEQWREQFDDATTRLFNEQVGDLARAFGYSIDKLEPRQSEDNGAPG